MPTTKLTKMKRQAATPQVPSSDDPAIELKRLVREHRALTRRSVAIAAMVSDKVARKDIPARGLKKGDAIKSDVPEDARQEALLLSEAFSDKASGLESAMKRELKKIPVYQHFLSRVWGLGPVVASYLVAEVDIRKAVKPSNLRRFAGMAVIEGSLERRKAGEKSKYNADLRMRLFQMFTAMRRNAGKEDAPTVSTKYLKIWTDYKFRMLHSARVVDGKIQKQDPKGSTVSAKGFANSTGWHKAADVFLTDLYLIWRALEGLPAWCPYVAEKLGYWHGGDIPAWSGGRMLTLEEALTLVGEVGAEKVATAAE